MEAWRLAVSSSDICIIGAVVGRICRHDWKSRGMAALVSVVEWCKNLLRWVVSLAVSDEAADE